jgi:hypothetical protein
MGGPNIDASLYWIDEDAELSFRRVCAYLIERGMEQTDADVEAGRADFKTASQRHRASTRPAHSRTVPGRLFVMYDPISDDARTAGDHPAIEVSWTDVTQGLPDTPKHVLQNSGLRDYHFFVDLCRSLNPLYASLSVERFVDCAYDIMHDPKLGADYTFFCRDAFLGDDRDAFWSTYAYTEPVGEGIYGADYMYWNPRRRGVPLIHTYPESRRLLFRTAVKRAYRARFGKFATG